MAIIVGISFSSFWARYSLSQKVMLKGSEIVYRLPSNLNIWIPLKTNRVTRALCDFLAEKGGILKSFPRVPRLRILLLRGWGRRVKVTLQTCARIISVRVDGGMSDTIKHAQTWSEDPH